MGCGDACPIYPGKQYEDWALDDPAGQDLDAVRQIRDEIDARVQRLVAELAPELRRERRGRVSGSEGGRGGALRRSSCRAGPVCARWWPRRSALLRSSSLARRDHGRCHDPCARTSRCCDHVRPRDHGDDLRGRARLRGALQSGRHVRVRADASLPVDGSCRLLERAALRSLRGGGVAPRLARERRPRGGNAAVRVASQSFLWEVI